MSDWRMFRDQVAMREHHAFGQPGRPARIGEHDDVRARVDGDCRRLTAREHQLDERRNAIRLAEDEDLSHARIACGLFRLQGTQRYGDDSPRSESSSCCVSSVWV